MADAALDPGRRWNEQEEGQEAGEEGQEEQEAVTAHVGRLCRQGSRRHSRPAELPDDRLALLGLADRSNVALRFTCGPSEPPWDFTPVSYGSLHRRVVTSMTRGVFRRRDLAAPLSQEPCLTSRSTFRRGPPLTSPVPVRAGGLGVLALTLTSARCTSGSR